MFGSKEQRDFLADDTARKVSQIVFFLTFGFYMILMTASVTSLRYESGPYLKNIRHMLWICCGLALVNLISFCGYTVRQLTVIFLFCALFAFVWLKTGRQEYLFLQSMMIAFSCRNVQWEKLLRFTFWFWIPLFGTVVALNFLGILPSLTSARGDKPRYSLGFSHPNVVGLCCLCFVFLWLLIRYKRLKVYDCLAWLAIAAFTWNVPNSKTSTFLLLLLCIVTLVMKKWGDAFVHSKFMQGLFLSVYPAFAVLSYLMAYFYTGDSPFYLKLDQVLFSGRLRCARVYFDMYTLTLFGQKIKNVGTMRAAKKGIPSYILDNFYLRLLINSGIIPFLIILAIFVALVYKALRLNDQSLLIVLLITAVYCVYEFQSTKLIYSITLFQCIYFFFPVRSGEKKRQLNRTGKKE